MKHPLVAVALCYGAGVILGHFLEAPLLGTFITAFAVALAALCFRFLRPLLLPALLLLFGWLNISARQALVSPHDLRALVNNGAELLTLRGRLIETPSLRVVERNDKESWHAMGEIRVTEVRLRRGDWQPAFGRVMSRTSGLLSSNLCAGQAIEITGIVQTPPPPIAEGTFDYARYLQQRGIHYELKVDSAKDWQLVGAAISPPMSDQFRAWGQRTLARGLPEQDESLRLQWAMLLGWQTALTAEVSEPFMRSGTMHIFAISGLHIALIAGILAALLRALALPRLVCGALVIPAIWFYTAATGWQASAIRSTVMMSVIILGWSLKRPPNLLNSLAMAAVLILVWQPEQLSQAGFQLSFFVVLSIALLTPPLEQWRSKIFKLDPLLPFDLRPRWQRSGIKFGDTVGKWFITSLAALIGSMPLIAYYFHLFTPGSLLANLVVVPISSLALMSGLGAIVTGDVVPWLTELFNHAGWFWMRLMIHFSETAANAPGSWWHVRTPGPLVFALYYGVLLTGCAGWFRRPGLRWLTTGVAVLLVACWFWDWRRDRSWHRMTVVPLNGGHAIYAEPRGAPEWLVDCGDNSAVEFTLKPFLQANGVDWLDNFLLTHGDSRQIGGAIRLHQMFPVRQAWASPVPSRSPRLREALSELEVKAQLKRCATNGFEFPPWKILHPNAADRFAGADDNAVVALGTFDGVRVLLASDLGKAGQNALFTRHPELRAEIVIAGLPASGEPLASEWLTALRPRLIVIADSERPPTRAASRALLQRLRRTGADVISTRQSGATTLWMQNGKWLVKSARPRDAGE